MEAVVLRTLFELKDDLNLDANLFEGSFREHLNTMRNLHEKNALSLEYFAEVAKKDDEFWSILSAVPQLSRQKANINALKLKSAHRLQQKIVDEIVEKHKRGEKINLLEYMDASTVFNSDIEVLSMADAMEKYRQQGRQKFISCGISEIDDALDGGFELGRLVLVSGEKESGKTTLMEQILRHMALSNKVCMYSFEFPIASTIRRMDVCKGIHNIDNNVKQNFFYAQNISRGKCTIESLRDSMINEFYTKGTQVFLVDSQMMLEAKKGFNQSDTEGAKFTALASLVNNPKFNFLIFLIIQTSKDKEDKDPQGSKNGGHAAGIMLDVSFDEKVKVASNIRTIRILKNKQTGKYGAWKFKIINGEFVSNFEEFVPNWLNK